MKTKHARTPSGDTIFFDPKWHSFKSMKNPQIKFVSGTRFVSGFFEPFDKDRIAAQTAKKRGVPVEDLLAQWDRKGKVSIGVGNLVHSFVEAQLLGDTPVWPQDCEADDEEIVNLATQKCKIAQDAVAEILEDYEILGVESIVACVKAGLGTLVDIDARHKKTGVRSILDWKTNESISFSAFRNKCGLGACSSVEDCKYNHYSLQVGLSEWMLKEEGYVPKDELFENAIIHIGTDEYSILPCVDMQKTIDSMVAERLSCGITWDDWRAQKEKTA